MRNLRSPMGSSAGAAAAALAGAAAAEAGLPATAWVMAVLGRL